jgi:hypothetical protein
VTAREALQRKEPGSREAEKGVMFTPLLENGQRKNTEKRTDLKVGHYKEESPVTSDLATGGR